MAANVYKHNTSTSLFIEGAASGIPIFIGYFSASIAFGLLSRNTGLIFLETILFSVTNFAGASQFLAINLIGAGAAVSEIIIGILLVNMRYFLMSASLNTRITEKNPIKRGIIAFGNTDEVFTVASTRSKPPDLPFMVGIESVSWSGWISGTAVGFFAGSLLSNSLQIAMGGALYALFAALLAPEIKKSVKALILAGTAALINTICVYLFNISIGWSFVIALISASVFGAALFKGTGYHKAQKGETT